MSTQEEPGSIFDDWPIEKQELKRLLTRTARAMGVRVPSGGFPEEWFVKVLERLSVHDRCDEPPRPQLHIVR